MVFNNNQNKKFNSNNLEENNLKIQNSNSNHTNFNAKMNKINMGKLDVGGSGGGGGGENTNISGGITLSNYKLSIGPNISSNDAGGKKLSSEDKKINLNALKNQDPFATNIIDTALRVAVYKFVSKKNEWKKLDVEGSLFLFERMVEPLHSFVVMNTLALHLFLQPITSDLEFQDRNPFLLYKSNSDIYGIWFIDKEDCERIKSLIINLTESAKERRIKREKNNFIQDATPVNTTNLGTTCSTLESFKCPNLPNQNEITNTINNNNNSTTNENKPNIDIMKMLSKAQIEYNQSKNSTVNNNNVVDNSLLHMIKNCNINNNNEIATNWSHELLIGSSNKNNINQEDLIKQQQPISLNTSSASSSPPTSSASSTSTGYSSSSVRDEDKKMNPILQLLLPATFNHQNEQSPIDTNKQVSLSLKNVINSINAKANNINTPTPPTPSAQELLTQELKRKLNIQSNATVLSDNEDKLLTSTLMQTPSNPLILNSFGNNGCVKSFDQSNIKRPITLQDFEQNLLNESSTSTPSNQMYPQQQQASTLFYLGDSGSNLILRPNHLTFNNKNDNNNNKDLKQYSSSSSNSASSHHSSSSAASTLSSRSSRSSSTSSSTSSKSSSTASSEPPMSPTTLPLLLTPAAFESSSVSSSTSTTSSLKANTNHHFFSTQHVSLIEQQHLANSKKTHSTNSTNSLAASSFGNILFSNQLINFNDLAAAAASKSSKIKQKKSKSNNLNQLTVLNKSQLKQVMIHLLTNDDKFITSLHQAYLEANINMAQNKAALKQKSITSSASATALSDVTPKSETVISSS